MHRPVNHTRQCWVDGIDRLEHGLLPSRCLLCAEPGHGGLDLCADCLATLPWWPPTAPPPLPAHQAGPASAFVATPVAGSRGAGEWAPLAAVHAVFVYARPVDQLLRRFKFHEDLAAGRLLAQLMARRLAARARPPLLVPVPLHPARLRARGYDQAAELARVLGRRLGLPRRALLRRRRPTAPQSELAAAARLRNLREAFDCRAPVSGTLVLVDDVMTTGATLRAAASALRAAGADRVEAWVCARVP